MNVTPKRICSASEKYIGYRPRRKVACERSCDSFARSIAWRELSYAGLLVGTFVSNVGEGSDGSIAIVYNEGTTITACSNNQTPSNLDATAANTWGVMASSPSCRPL